MRAGISSTGYNPRRSRVEIDFDGLIGEAAVATLLGVDVDRKLHLHGDAGWDIEEAGGRYQVKYNTHRNGQLYFSSIEEFKAPVAILVTQEEDLTYRLRGWISKDRFMKVYHETDYGYGTRYAVDQEQLEPISTLLWRDVNAFSESL
jgi:hypothetical protein